jgi:hypothetical protein
MTLVRVSEIEDVTSLEPSSSAIRRGRIRFLGSDIHECSLASSSSSSRLVYLFVRCMMRVVVFNMNSIRPIVVIKEL